MDMPYNNNKGKGLKFEPSAKEKPIPNFRFPGKSMRVLLRIL